MKKSLALLGAAALVMAGSMSAHAADGESVYKGGTVPTCASCHDFGAAESPRVGHPGDWGERLDKSVDELVETVKGGQGAMPPMGHQASDEEIRAAVEYMLGTLE